jgi:hypothetical protein
LWATALTNLNLTAGSPTYLWLQDGYGLKRRRLMMRPMISAVAVAALIVVAAYGLRSKSPSIELSAAAMPSLQELHDLADVNKIPNQEIEDQSLVYPTATKP